MFFTKRNIIGKHKESLFGKVSMSDLVKKNVGKRFISFTKQNVHTGEQTDFLQLKKYLKHQHAVLIIEKMYNLF